MNIINTLRINFRKLKAYKSKAIFLIVPIVILMVLSIIVTSETANFQTAAESSIFGTITAANQIIELTKNGQNSRFGNFTRAGGAGGASGGTVTFSANATAGGGGGSTSDQFTESDLSTVKAIAGVDTADIITNVPVSNVVAKSLLSKDFTISELSAIDPKLAAQFTDQSFTYDASQPIPIIINSNDFVEHVESWNGQTSITIGLSRGSTPTDVSSQFPIKTQAIPYTKDDLIGKTFTLNVGGFTAQQDYTNAPSASGLTFTQLTADQIAANEQTRRNDIAPYWDYDKLNTPTTYTFKVVGVIEDANMPYSFIPQDVANKLVADSIQHQLDSRSTGGLDASNLDSKFQGLTWDGLELRQSGVSGFGGVGGGVRLRFVGGAAPTRFSAGSAPTLDTSATYDIPGLVIQIDRTSNDVIGVYSDPNVYNAASQSSGTMLVRVDDISNRGSVVTALNNAGFAYQDTSKLSVITELKNTLNNIVLGVAVGFVAISILVIIFTMGKFVSESKREIGVFRALGATRGEIRTLFLSQSVFYVFLGYLVGAVVGIGSVIALTTVVQGAFDNFIGKTLKETFAVVNPVSSGVFSQVNWQLFAVFSLALLVITIITSLIPATTAANVSPVEAIRGE